MYDALELTPVKGYSSVTPSHAARLAVHIHTHLSARGEEACKEKYYHFPAVI